MNFPPPPATARASRRKPALISVIAVSWCLIIASVVTIVINLNSADEAATAAEDTVEESATAADEATAGLVDAELVELAAAYADGDRDAWMARFGDETADEAGRYYDNLKALGAGAVELRTIGETTESGAGTRVTYMARIGLSYCLRPADEADCAHTEVDLHAIWGRGDDGLVVDQWRDIETSSYRPQAWEAAELTVATGDRVTIAAAADADVNPADYLDTAEAAAANADQYALLAPVDSYLVILATDDQFNTWYGGYENDVSLGSAIPTAADAETEETSGPLHLMVPYSRHDTSSIENTLRHELGHAATLQGAELRAHENPDTWWAMEGIAEYVAHGDTLASHRTADTQALAADGGCSAGIAAMASTDSATVASGKYGCSYLAVRYIIDTYGLDAFLEWFQTAHHQGVNIATATQEHFGTDHGALLTAIGAYIDDSV